MVFRCSEDEDVHTTLRTMKGLECATRRGRAEQAAPCDFDARSC